MARVVAGSDVVITTVAVPGQKSPVLVTRKAVEGPCIFCSVIIDLAAERGGNCEVTQAGQCIVYLTGSRVPLFWGSFSAEIPQHASQMYAKNISMFLLNLVKDKQVQINLEKTKSSAIRPHPQDRARADSATAGWNRVRRLFICFGWQRDKFKRYFAIYSRRILGPAAAGKVAP